MAATHTALLVQDDVVSTANAEATEDLKKSLRSQTRYEINGDELKNPERFMIDQKFGLIDPVLTKEEKALIAGEESRLTAHEILVRKEVKEYYDRNRL